MTSPIFILDQDSQCGERISAEPTNAFCVRSNRQQPTKQGKESDRRRSNTLHQTAPRRVQLQSKLWSFWPNIIQKLFRFSQNPNILRLEFFFAMSFYLVHNQDQSRFKNTTFLLVHTWIGFGETNSLIHTNSIKSFKLSSSL